MVGRAGRYDVAQLPLFSPPFDALARALGRMSVPVHHVAHRSQRGPEPPLARDAVGLEGRLDHPLVRRNPGRMPKTAPSASRQRLDSPVKRRPAVDGRQSCRAPTALAPAPSSGTVSKGEADDGGRVRRWVQGVVRAVLFGWGGGW